MQRGIYVPSIYINLGDLPSGPQRVPCSPSDVRVPYKWSVKRVWRSERRPWPSAYSERMPLPSIRSERDVLTTQYASRSERAHVSHHRYGPLRDGDIARAAAERPTERVMSNMRMRSPSACARAIP